MLLYRHLAGCVIFGRSIAMLLPSNFDLTVPFTLTLLGWDKQSRMNRHKQSMMIADGEDLKYK